MSTAETVPAPDVTAFRKRVRAWLEANAEPFRPADALPSAESGEGVSVDDAKAFQKRLYDAGFAGLTWPPEFGGQGLSLRDQLVFNEEAAAFHLPLGKVFAIGLGMCGPTILASGSEEQQRRYIPPLLRGEEIWCQLFSEPEAGSDLASLRCRAARSGDRWIISGQKVWSSGAHHSDFGLILTRSDPDLPKHRGLTMFVLDMATPGVTIRPLRQMTGSAPFNEVFLDDVEIPAENIVGAVNDGWRVALGTLMNERMALGAGSGVYRDDLAEVLIDLARERGLTDNPVIRNQLAAAWIEQTILGYLGRRALEAVAQGRPPGPEGSVAKLARGQLNQLMAELAVHLAGPGAVAWTQGNGGSHWAQLLLASPGRRLAGGTDEIQRNIIAERVLGLPKDNTV